MKDKSKEKKIEFFKLASMTYFLSKQYSKDYKSEDNIMFSIIIDKNKYSHK